MRRVIASWFGTGLILGLTRGSHLGSGTLAAATALPIAWLVGRWLGWGWQIAVAVALISVGLWAVSSFVATEGDAGWIVIDEVSGVFVATIGLGFRAAVVAWIVFRAADIFKRLAPGVAPAEHLPGAVGVIADDVVAAVYGLAAGLLVQSLL